MLNKQSIINLCLRRTFCRVAKSCTVFSVLILLNKFAIMIFKTSCPNFHRGTSYEGTGVSIFWKQSERFRAQRRLEMGRPCATNCSNAYLKTRVVNIPVVLFVRRKHSKFEKNIQSLWNDRKRKQSPCSHAGLSYLQYLVMPLWYRVVQSSTYYPVVRTSTLYLEVFRSIFTRHWAPMLSSSSA